MAPKLAKKIVLERQDGGYRFEIDGVEFPWYVRDVIKVDLAQLDVPSVTVQILADRVEVIDEPVDFKPVEAIQSRHPVRKSAATVAQEDGGS